MTKGIDVSSNNGVIDWNKVKSSGINFAFIRIGWGLNLTKQDDIKALANCKGAAAAGIPYGLYIYSYALNTNQVISEVEHMLRFAGQTKPSLGLWLDMEDADGYKKKHNLDPHKNGIILNNFCRIWLENVKKAGYKAGIYASYDYFKNVLDYKDLRQHGMIWLAQWNTKNPSLKCDIWQYANNGTVKGISGRVDMDYSYTSKLKPSKQAYLSNKFIYFLKIIVDKVKKKVYSKYGYK